MFYPYRKEGVETGFSPAMVVIIARSNVIFKTLGSY